MPEHKLSDQIKQMQQRMQRMRLAIIIIVAFFIYEALGPLPFGRERTEVQQMLKVRELHIVGDRGEVIAYLGGDAEGAGLVLHDAVGKRLDARAGVIKLSQQESDRQLERLRIQIDGIEVYDRNGRVTGHMP